MCRPNQSKVTRSLPAYHENSPQSDCKGFLSPIAIEQYEFADKSTLDGIYNMARVDIDSIAAAQKIQQYCLPKMSEKAKVFLALNYSTGEISTLFGPASRSNGETRVLAAISSG
jgi:hypothetical protein